MATSPDFYLTTAGEYEPLSEPRACEARARLRDDLRDDYMLVDIDPPLPGQRFGLGSVDVTSLVLSSRHRGQTLYPISEWPSYVYVARVTSNQNTSMEAVAKGQLELIAWGALFKSQREAAEYAESVGR